MVFSNPVVALPFDLLGQRCCLAWFSPICGEQFSDQKLSSRISITGINIQMFGSASQNQRQRWSWINIVYKWSGWGFLGFLGFYQGFFRDGWNSRDGRMVGTVGVAGKVAIYTVPIQPIYIPIHRPRSNQHPIFGTLHFPPSEKKINWKKVTYMFPALAPRSGSGSLSCCVAMPIMPPCLVFWNGYSKQSTCCVKVRKGLY